MSNIEKSEYSPLVSQADVSKFEHPEKPTKEDISYYKGNVQPRLFQISNMIAQHKSEKDIFSFLGISESQFNLYKRWFPDFKNAVTQGKYSMVTQIESSLAQLATGGEFEESEIVNVYEPDPNTGEMTLVQKRERITTKVAQPNIRAIEMYLTNRNPENWKRSQPDTYTQNNTQAILNVSGEDIKELVASFQKSFMVDTKQCSEPIDVEVVDG